MPAPPFPAARLVAIEGPSGVGKTTVARLLADRWGADCLPEAFDRILPQLDLEFQGRAQLLRLERRLLTEEGRRFREGRRLCADGRTVVADTGFSGPLTYSAGLAATIVPPVDVLPPLLRTARSSAQRGRWGVADVMVYLAAPPDLVARRAAGDTDRHPSQFVARHITVGQFERRLWVRAGRALPQLGVRVVSATGRLAGVVDRVEDALRRSRPSHPAAPSTTFRWLDFLESIAGPSHPATVKSRGRSARPPR